MSDADRVELADRGAWRAWLEANHDRSDGVWLVFHKDHTGIRSIAYDDSVCEALCFGWVDSKSRSVDDERTSLYFTPRKPKSAWSASNVARIERLEAAGALREPGRRAVEEARERGTWPS